MQRTRFEEQLDHLSDETVKLGLQVHQNLGRSIAALLDRDIAVSAQNRAFTRTSTIFEQCCELVGEDELAARIRHTIAKSGNTIEDIDDEASK